MAFDAYVFPIFYASPIIWIASFVFQMETRLTPQTEATSAVINTVVYDIAGRYWNQTSQGDVQTWWHICYAQEEPPTTSMVQNFIAIAVSCCVVGH